MARCYAPPPPWRQHRWRMFNVQNQCPAKLACHTGVPQYFLPMGGWLLRYPTPTVPPRPPFLPLPGPLATT